MARKTVFVERDALAEIPMPEETSTYKPVAHYALANKMATIGSDILSGSGYALATEQYELARTGNQMFAILTFENHVEMRLSLGYRNSLDKSMALGFCIGAQVMVCSNLSFHGEITVMRKHTGKILEELEDIAVRILYRAKTTHQTLISDAEHMRSIPYDDDLAFGTLGRLFGYGALSARQIPVARDHWTKPAHEEFQPRNAWSFYNSVTEALKSSPPSDIIEKHVLAHNIVLDKDKVIDLERAGDDEDYWDVKR